MDSQPPGIRLIALERKLNALQLQVDGLHQQLAEARVSMMELVSSLRPAAEEAAADEPAGMARAVPTAPPTVPVRPIHIEPPPSAVRPADEIAPTPPVEVPPTPRRPLPFKEERHVNWEAVIGANWLNRIGVLVLLLAGAFLAHLAWQRHWINPTAQTVFVFAVGVALLVAGEVFQRRNVLIFAQGLTSLGIFALYAGGFMGYHLHGLLSLNATFIAYTVITAIAFLLAARTNSIAVVLMGMLGGYLTPVILSTGQDAPIALFTYLLFLNAAIAATAIAKRWDFLQLIAFAATFIMFAGWFIKFYEPPKRWTIEWMLSLHAGLFMLASVVPRVVLG
ncbi:MAG TPA: DUF2339 domain-containing protein, partial [Phycisphaerae bacterium]|nr:DUF2339 domain-containing protein [Phycisphaerae bacterium]